MKKAIMLLSLLMSLSFATLAQERTVSGTISDANGEPLPGVAVILKGTTQGTVTNIDGGYRLTVSGQNPTLVFKLVGFVQVERAVGSSSAISLSLEEDMKQLDEVVVSALGFEEDIDKLGSAPSKIAAESIVQSGEANLINGLAGKASGVRINSTSGDPGAGSSIQIRGQATINGGLDPLIIVDGMPINNSSVGESTNSVDGVAQQSRLNDINPNDIESMQVLKGASAAALWGSRAANGVIVITTKKGSSTGKKMNVSYRASYSIDEINRKPELQSTYGQGWGGAYVEGILTSWGDKIADRKGGSDIYDETGSRFEAQNGNLYYPISEKNSRDVYTNSNWDEIFQNGSFLDQNISISGGDRDGSFMFSVSDMDQRGVVKNSNYKRTTARLNTMKRFSDKFKLTNTFNYTHSKSERTQKGSNTSGLMLGLLRTPADFDMRDYKGTYYGEDGTVIENTQRTYRDPLGTGAPRYDNPLWTVNEQSNPSKLNRFIGTAEAQLLPVEWLDFTLRTGVDYFQENRATYFAEGSAATGGAGFYEEDNISELQFNVDLLGRVQKQITSDLMFTGVLGFNYNQRDYERRGGEMNEFTLATAPPNFTNSTNDVNSPSNFYRTIKTAAVYGTANFSFKDRLFVNGTLRGEAASTYGEEEKSVYYYPSADAAYQILNTNSGALSFAKVRASWGQVGVQPGAYLTRTLYAATTVTESWGPSLAMSGYGGGFGQSFRAGNPFLKPEIKTEWEIGTDLRFLSNKAKLGITYFSNETNDLLLDVDLAPSSGFANQFQNAGSLENQGIELDLGYEIFKNADWRVSVDLNWTKINSKVTDINGSQFILLTGFTSTASGAAEGHPVGALWGTDFQRNDDGSYVLDDNGFPMEDPEEKVIGDPNPDWRGGLGATVSYKGFRLYALVEHSQGGDVWNGTRGALSYFGKTIDQGGETTASSEVTAWDGTTYASGDTFRGEIADFGGGPVALDQSWYTSGPGSGFTGPGKNFVEDATWTRLREVTLSYSLRMPALKRAIKISSIDLSVTGRNLFLWTDYKGVDPDTNLTGATANGRGLDYFNNPSTRSWVFTAAFNW
ncbi:SusC/RagA family TonB-linked outer membrane protein [Flammeovirga sp. SJP92]|uniref:SusC/RagA family TonB-linked outer membrane protein n=1 Tax=Flammeovirga sp. SJP92 TaxID=1775430 RepID=UPI000787E7E0|nr:SusC/RagA family TonB-linked outer membrane protein [Flammeovirga sp. SJP92]KXX67735.1 hypothetical protein AVL50_25035 [Flammeovirga sp. SJP92]